MVNVPVNKKALRCSCQVCRSNALSVFQAFKYLMEHMGDVEFAERYGLLEGLFAVPSP